MKHLIPSDIYKDYSYLVGKEIKMMLKESFDSNLYGNVWLPAKVVAEYPKFIMVEILPHINPNNSFGMSKPYQMGINKTRLFFHEVEIKY